MTREWNEEEVRRYWNETSQSEEIIETLMTIYGASKKKILEAINGGEDGNEEKKPEKASQEETPKKKRHRRTKAEIEAARAQETERKTSKKMTQNTEKMTQNTEKMTQSTENQTRYEKRIPAEIVVELLETQRKHQEQADILQRMSEEQAELARRIEDFLKLNA